MAHDPIRVNAVTARMLPPPEALGSVAHGATPLGLSTRQPHRTPNRLASTCRLASVLVLLGGLTGCAVTWTSADTAPHGAFRSAPCSPFEGTWVHGGMAIPITRIGNRLAVNMAAFRRPTATGRVIGDRQIEVSFPDDATFTGVLDRQGTIRWSNGTTWEATGFSGRWRHDGQPGPIVTQRGNRLEVSMAAYGRPDAEGVLTGPSTASVRFADDAVHTATLIGPACLQWSNGTYWTK